MTVNHSTRPVLLITGGSGYLGRHLAAKATETFQVYATYSSHPTQIKAGEPVPLDLTRREMALHLITELSPQTIIHTAAINPGSGSSQEMWRVNIEGSRYVAEAAARVGARLVHLSTDVVHNGRHAPYADNAPPSPINDYGRSKATAEAVVAEINPQSVIVRTSLIYGLAEIDRGTAGFVDRLKSGRPLALFSDVIRQPVWVDTLVEALLKLTQLEFAGILNVAGRQALSREEFGRKMLTWWGVDIVGLLQSGRAAEISSTIPLDLRMSVTKAEQLLQMMFPGTDEVLAMNSQA